MNTSTRVRLSAMMFLQFFVWGTWYATMVTYLAKTLKFTDPQIGLAYGTVAIAAMISPFFMGYFADRFFATERVLGILHIVGGLVAWWVSGLGDFGSFYPALLLYTLTYMPTLALTNSLAFHHVSDPAKDFPGLRVFGTIGWIVAGLLLGFLKLEDSALQFKMTAVAALLLGVFSFTLPHTPPKKKEGPVSVGDVLGFQAFSLFKDRNFSILVLSSFLVCIPLFFYYSYCNGFLNEIGMENAAGKMTMGQMSEIIFMLAMPLFFKRLGVKKMIIIGIVAWIARYLLFAYGNNEGAVGMLYLGIILHGVCYDFFFVTGQIYVDEKAPVEIRGAAQGLITFATFGVGNFVGTWMAGQVANANVVQTATGQGHNWTSIWLVPAGLAAVVLLLFWFLFREERRA